MGLVFAIYEGVIFDDWMVMKIVLFEEFGLFLFPSPNRLGASGVTDELGCSGTTIN